MTSGIRPPSAHFGLVHLNRNQRAINTSLERLATGSRINRGADDPAGLVAAEGFKTDIRRLEARIESYEINNLRLGIQDAGVGELGSLVQELNGLIVTAANGDALGDNELDALQIEADSIIEAIDLIALTSSFKGEQLLAGYVAGSLGRRELENPDDPGSEDTTTVSLASLRTGGRLDFRSGELEKAQEIVGDVSESLATARGSIGNKIRQNDSLLRVAETELINVSDALSQIQDTDYARETGELIRNQILQEATIRSIQMARELAADSVLSLLESVK